MAPGAAADPIQLVDVRDLRLARHAGGTGLYGSLQRYRARKPVDVGRSVGGMPESDEDGELADVGSGEWIAKQGEDIFPIWAPYLGETSGFHTWKITRA